MSDICRICLKSGILISLFTTKDSIKLSDKIMMCASVRIVSNDNLPSQICPACIDRLNASYDFKILCESSDLFLRKQINGNINTSSGNDIKSEYSPTISCETIIKCNIDNTKSKKTPDDNFLISDISVTDLDVNYLKRSKKFNPSNNISPSKKITLKKKSQRMNKIISNIEVPPNCTKYIPYGEDDILSNCDDSNSDANVNSDENIINSADNFDSDNKLPRQNISKLCNNTLKKNNKCKSTNKSNKEQCSTCGKVMSSKFRLKMHLRIHTGEKPFTCNYCGKTFALSQNLKVHERVHTGEKPLLCGICGKAFAQSAGLVTHMRLHTGETPYKCTLCPMKYRTPGHLQYHIRQHTGEKNFECNICQKAFITKGDLTQHAKIHTGEKPYICTICGLRMSRSSHLTRHLMTHTGEKPHRCNTCGSSYAQKGDLARHIKKHPIPSCKTLDLHSETKSIENIDCKQSNCEKIAINNGNDDRIVIVENKIMTSDNVAIKTLTNDIEQNSREFKYEFILDRHNIVKKETAEPELLSSNFN